MTGKFIKIQEVVARTTLSRATIYKSIKEGTFPQQYKLSPLRSAWLENEINKWIEDRVSERGVHCE